MKGKKMYDEESSSNKTNKQDDSWDNSKNYDDKKNSFYNKISKDVEKTVPHSKGIVTSNVSDNKLKSSANTKDFKYSNISDDKKKFNDFNNFIKSSNDQIEKSSHDTFNSKKKISSEEISKSYDYNKEKIKSSVEDKKSDSEEGDEEDESYEEEDGEIEDEYQEKNNSDEESESDEESDEDDKSEGFNNTKIALKNSKNEINRAPTIKNVKDSQKIEIPIKNKERKIKVVRKSQKLVLGEKKIINSKGEIDFNLLYPNDELNTIKTPFTVDIVQLADECFDIYQVTVKNRYFRLIDVNEVQNLLDVLGIKKNLFEIKNCIIDLKRTKKFRNDDKYSKQNFLDIVEFFRNYRIDDKILAEVYREIDSQCDGYITFEDIQYISRTKNLNFSKEEINDILNYFELENIVKSELQNKTYISKEKNYFDFEKFCKLYYQG
jgi:hypothetical protein